MHSLLRSHSSRFAPRPGRRGLIALIASTIALLGASAAQASTVDYTGDTMTIMGTDGADDILMSHGATEDWGGSDPQAMQHVTISEMTDTPITLTPNAAAGGCVPNGVYSDFVCPRPNRIVVHLGAGDDEVSVYEDSDPALAFTVPIEAYGGDGNDVMDGASGNDTFFGGTGNDRLTGRGGNDALYGEDGNDVLNGDFGASWGGGNDHLDGGAGDDEFEGYVGFGSPASLAGADTYIGGPGNDSFSYFHRADPVTISLDGVANDGMAGEFDNIHPDIETVGGSAGNDVIVGSDGPNHLWGGDGDDIISGLGGDDKLSGDGGNDVIDGGSGNDELVGGCETDTLIGGPGADTFFSDASPNSTCGYSLRSPFDRIEAADGEADALIFCQQTSDLPGDTAIVDAIDPVTNSGPGACQNITVVAATPPPSSGGGGAPAPPSGGGTAPKPPANQCPTRPRFNSVIYKNGVTSFYYRPQAGQDLLGARRLGTKRLRALLNTPKGRSTLPRLEYTTAKPVDAKRLPWFARKIGPNRVVTAIMSNANSKAYSGVRLAYQPKRGTYAKLILPKGTVKTTAPKCPKVTGYATIYAQNIFVNRNS